MDGDGRHELIVSASYGTFFALFDEHPLIFTTLRPLFHIFIYIDKSWHPVSNCILSFEPLKILPIIIDNEHGSSPECDVARYKPICRELGIRQL